MEGDDKHVPGPVFCLLLGVSSDYAQLITGQVTEATCPVIGRAQPEITPSKRQKMGPDQRIMWVCKMLWYFTGDHVKHLYWGYVLNIT